MELTGHIPAVSEQAALFLLSIALGLPAGILLDAMRLLRVLIPHCAAAVFLEDALYVFCLMLLHQCFTVMFMHGSLRFYPLLGTLLGLALYLLTAGTVTGRLLRQLRRLRTRCSRHLHRKSEKNSILQKISKTS